MPDDGPHLQPLRGRLGRGPGDPGAEVLNARKKPRLTPPAAGVRRGGERTKEDDRV